MNFYHRVRNADGTYSMVEQLGSQTRPVPLIAPPITAGASGKLKRYFCTACTPPKPFASAGVASIHFAKKHAEKRVDGNSWRAFVREFGDLPGVKT